MSVKVERIINFDLSKSLKNLDGKVGKVGWFQGTKYPDKNGTPVAYVAAIHEKGSPSNNIPARPFIKPTIAQHANEWRRIVSYGANSVLNGKTTLNAVFTQLVRVAAGDIKVTISKILYPALKESTIRARLNRKSNKKVVGNLTKPLVDTGHLRDTVLGKVEDE